MNIIVQELVNLVGGSSSESVKFVHKTLINRNSGKTETKNLTKLDHAIHHIASGTGTKKTFDKKETAINKAAAAKAIPLDDKTNKEDFKNFNS
jgi:hypothetical protein